MVRVPDAPHRCALEETAHALRTLQPRIDLVAVRSRGRVLKVEDVIPDHVRDTRASDVASDVGRLDVRVLRWDPSGQGLEVQSCTGPRFATLHVGKDLVV